MFVGFLFLLVAILVSCGHGVIPSLGYGVDLSPSAADNSGQIRETHFTVRPLGLAFGTNWEFGEELFSLIMEKVVVSCEWVLGFFHCGSHVVVNSSVGSGVIPIKESLICLSDDSFYDDDEEGSEIGERLMMNGELARWCPALLVEK